MIARAYRRVKDFVVRIVAWLDCHPRTGWYVAVCATINVVLNILNLIH